MDAEAKTEDQTASQKAEIPKTKSNKVGITIQSLSNAYWAGVMGKLEEQLKDKGWDYTLIDCEDNSATQVSQIENFITSGCDLIMVHPSDAKAVENICKEALDADIKVMCWMTRWKTQRLTGYWTIQSLVKRLVKQQLNLLTIIYADE